MAISRSHDKKSPSQSPTAYYKMEVKGGTNGKISSVPDKQPSGPMREKVMGGKK